MDVLSSLVWYKVRIVHHICRYPNATFLTFCIRSPFNLISVIVLPSLLHFTNLHFTNLHVHISRTLPSFHLSTHSSQEYSSNFTFLLMNNICNFHVPFYLFRSYFLIIFFYFLCFFSIFIICLFFLLSLIGFLLPLFLLVFLLFFCVCSWFSCFSFSLFCI